VPFVIFFIAATAELNRPPFDLVEAEQELVGGFHTEYSSFRFGLFYVAEFMNTITMSAIVVTLFLGGPSGPEIDFLPSLWPVVWFLLKVLAFLFGYVWLRATLPRFRYDQLMDLGWKKLIPLSLGWLLLIAAIRIGEDRDWSFALTFFGGLAALAVAWALLQVAVRVGRQAAEVPPTPAPAPEEVSA
jgi:NADH-quinone oxidoreductase subunit H